jgi:hypothetical protein
VTTYNRKLKKRQELRSKIQARKRADYQRRQRHPPTERSEVVDPKIIDRILNASRIFEAATRGAMFTLHEASQFADSLTERMGSIQAPIIASTFDPLPNHAPDDAIPKTARNGYFVVITQEAPGKPFIYSFHPQWKVLAAMTALARWPVVKATRDRKYSLIGRDAQHSLAATIRELRKESARQ